MKKIIYTLSLLVAVGFLTMSLYPAGAAAGGNIDATGSPLSNGNCGQAGCHTPGIFTTTTAISIKDSAGVAVTGYVPGKTYTVRVAVAGTPATGKYGFEMIDMKGTTTTTINGFAATGLQVTGVKQTTLGTRKFVEFNGVSSTGIFDCKWIAPAAGNGNVVFYAAGMTVNGNGSGDNRGDNATSAQLTVSEIRAGNNEIAGIEGVSIATSFSGEFFEIGAISSDSKACTVRIVNVKGQLVGAHAWSMVAGDNKLHVSTAGLGSGVYAVAIMHGNEMLTKKFLKL
jgi:hypothetical protein